MSDKQLRLEEEKYARWLVRQAEEHGKVLVTAWTPSGVVTRGEPIKTLGLSPTSEILQSEVTEEWYQWWERKAADPAAT